jgi:hypothetical protein
LLGASAGAAGAAAGAAAAGAAVPGETANKASGQTLLKIRASVINKKRLIDLIFEAMKEPIIMKK